MKSLVAVVSTLFRDRTTRYNLVALAKLILTLVLLITVYTVMFHHLMEREGQDHSYTTGVYWTLTVMSTLGFGDITFESDHGRLFSIVVLVSGVLFLLVLLPFTFIEFFYAPWIKAHEVAKAPTAVPLGTEHHVIMTRCGPVAKRLMHLLEEYGYCYFFVSPTVERALEMQDDGLLVVVGDYSDPETYKRMNIGRAAMVVTTLDDVTNTNIAFAVRELSENVPIVASATTDSVRDALDLVGVTEVLRLDEMMGRALARRVVSNDASAHVIGEVDGLIIAEASPLNTSLLGKKIRESELRTQTGLTIVGLWNQGQFRPAGPEDEIIRQTILVLAGTQVEIDRFNAIYSRPGVEKPKNIVAGGGRVGRATSCALTQAGLPWTLIEKQGDRVACMSHVVIGDASDLETAKLAGIDDAESIIITTHEDDLNIFLTIFFRRLRSDLQIISRCTHEKNVKRLQRAGADLVLSYAAMGANTIFNVLRGSDTLLLAEGVNIFRAPVPRSLAGKTVLKSAVRSQTDCSIIAVEFDGERILNPEPDTILPAKGKMVLIGSLEAETKFLALYKPESG